MNIGGALRCMAAKALTAAALLPLANTKFKGKPVALNQVQEKTGFVTGANTGIGLELAKELLKRNCKTFATFRERERSQELLNLAKENQGLTLIEADFSTTESTAEAVEKIQDVVGDTPIHLLFLNAGYFEENANKVGQIDGVAFSKSIQVNAAAPLMVYQALRDSFPKEDGTVICITSRKGSIARNIEERYANRLGYVASKAALNAIFSNISISEVGVRVLIVHPGAVWTPFTEGRGLEKKNLITPEQSVKGIMEKVIESDIKSGSFVDYLGKPIPW